MLSQPLPRYGEPEEFPTYKLVRETILPGNGYLCFFRSAQTVWNVIVRAATIPTLDVPHVRRIFHALFSTVNDLQYLYLVRDMEFKLTVTV